MIFKTAKGKEFETNYISHVENPDMLWIRVIGSDWKTVTEVFNDPEETMRISYGEKTYDGFTNLDYVMRDGNALKVRLKKDG